MLRLLWFVVTGFWWRRPEKVSVEVLAVIEPTHEDMGPQLLVQSNHDGTRWFIDGEFGEVGDKFTVFSDQLRRSSI